MQAYLGNGGKAPLILNISARKGRPPYLRRQNIPIPTEQEIGCAPEPVWRFAPTAKRTTIHQYA